jgi:PQQ enzyme repeat
MKTADSCFFVLVLVIASKATAQQPCSKPPLTSFINWAQFHSEVAVNGVVYIGDGSSGSIYALNASTGASLWTYTTGDTSAPRRRFRTKSLTSRANPKRQRLPRTFDFFHIS